MVNAYFYIKFMQNTLTGLLSLKAKAEGHKIESHIFSKLVKDGEAYQVFNSRDVSHINVNSYVNPERTNKVEPNRLFPSISEPSISRANNGMKRVDLSFKKKQKINPILKYNSQKWMQQARAKEEQVHLSKSKKKFDIKCRRIDFGIPGREVRKSQPAPFSLSKIVTRVRQSTDEVEYLCRQVDSSSDVDLRQRRITEDRLIHSKLSIEKITLPSQKQKRYEQYFKLSEPITGWNTNQVTNDNYF